MHIKRLGRLRDPSVLPAPAEDGLWWNIRLWGSMAILLAFAVVLLPLVFAFAFILLAGAYQGLVVPWWDAGFAFVTGGGWIVLGIGAFGYYCYQAGKRS